MKRLATLILLTFSFLPIFIHASHVAGGAIVYKKLSNNNYYVSAYVVRDCRGIALSQPTLTLTAACSGSPTSNTITLNHKPYVPSAAVFGGPHYAINLTVNNFVYNVQEVSDLCDNVLNPLTTTKSRCHGVTNTIGGYMRFEYSGIISLSSCSNMRLGFATQCCRNAMTNVNGGSTWIETAINTNDFPDNLPPNIIPERGHRKGFCIGQPSKYQFGVNDPDGDSLRYRFDCPKATETACAQFRSGYSKSSPLENAKLDSLTGEMSFNTSKSGNFQFGIRIDEYDRCTKKWKGSTLQDVQFSLQACTNKAPKYHSGILNNSSTAVKLDSFKLNVFEHQLFSFGDTIYDPDAQDTIVIYSDLKDDFPGATLSITPINKNKAYFTFTWRPISANNPNKLLKLELNDNRCPVPAKTSILYEINIVPRLLHTDKYEVDTVVVIKGDTLGLVTTSGGKVNWSCSSSDTLHWSGSSQNIFGDTTLADTNVTVKFIPKRNVTINANGNLIVGCASLGNVFDKIYVKVVPPFSIKVVNDTSVCYSTSDLLLNVSTDSNFFYTYKWSTDSGSIKNPFAENPFVSRKVSATYTVKVTSHHGGVREASVRVQVKNKPNDYNILLERDTLCLGSSATIEAKFSSQYGCRLRPKKPLAKYVGTAPLSTSYSSSTGTNQYPNPFSSLNPSSRQQFLYRADSLANAGLKAGLLQGISFFVDSNTFSNPDVFQRYSVKLKCVNDSTLNFWVNNNLNTVIKSEDFVVNQGWNSFEFDTAYHWDGKSNLIMELCYTNDSNSIRTFNCAMQDVAYDANLVNYANAFTCGSNSLSIANYKRLPVIKLKISENNDISRMGYYWSPGNSLSNDSLPKVLASPKQSTTYQLVMLDSNTGCTDTSHTSIRVESFMLHAGNDTSLCAGNLLQMNPHVFPAKAGSYEWFPTHEFYYSKSPNALHPVNDTSKIWLNYKNDYGCDLTDTLTINAIPLPDPTITSTGPFCEMDSMNLLSAKTSGGTFSGNAVTGSNFNSADPMFSPGLFSPDSARIHYSVTKNGCSSDTSITVWIYPQFDTNYTGPTDFCELDDSILLKTAHSGGLWAGIGVTQGYFKPKTGPGTYIVNVDSIGFCGNSGSYTFNVVRAPDLDFPRITYGCDKKPAVLDAGNIGSTYLWSTGDTSRVITATQNGLYWVKVSNGVNCSITDSTQVIITEICQGQEELTTTTGFNVYPNPATNLLHVGLLVNESMNLTVSLISSTGQLVYVKQTELSKTNELNIDVSAYSKGVYVLLLKQENSTVSYRIIIQ